MGGSLPNPSIGGFDNKSMLDIRGRIEIGKKLFDLLQFRMLKGYHSYCLGPYIVEIRRNLGFPIKMHSNRHSSDRGCNQLRNLCNGGVSARKSRSKDHIACA